MSESDLFKASILRQLVNPLALSKCYLCKGENLAPLLDLSFVRVVVPAAEPWQSFTESISQEVELELSGKRFVVLVSLRAKGEEWVRLGFDKMVPSARSQLRSFLSPKKIGESIVEDWSTSSLRHYHGLNESEIWLTEEGSILFTYLDSSDPDCQFLLRLGDSRGPLRVGKISRREYMEMESIDSELPLLPVGERESYLLLSECRDIVTNIRPTAQREYHLKQRLLRAISDSLYSTSHRVQMVQPRSPRPSGILDG